MRAGRSLGGIGLALIAIGLLPAAASAAPPASFFLSPTTPGQLVIQGGDGPEDTYLNCFSGFVRLTSVDPGDPATGPLPCDAVDSIHATLGGGDDILSLDEIYAEELGAFSGTTIDSGAGRDQILTVFRGDFSRPDFNAQVIANLGSKADRFLSGPGDDIIIGGSGADDLHGGHGRDLVRGQGGDDFLAGGSDPDRILGGPGGDSIQGGPGKDRMRGGPGKDEITKGRFFD